MSAPPEPLDPAPGERGLATQDRAALKRSVTRAWELAAAYAESADLGRPSRAGSLRALDVLLPVGRWPTSRGVADVVREAEERHRADDPGSGVVDQDTYEARLRRDYAGADAADVIAALRRAGHEAGEWLGSREDDRSGLFPTPSPLGPLPVRTLFHASVYQLAVAALAIEPAAPGPPPAELLTQGLIALIDVTGCLAARQGLDGALAADPLPEAGDATGEGAWAFGARDGSWVLRPLPAGDRSVPTVAATTRLLLTITAGQAQGVPGALRDGRLRVHDVAGLLRWAPLADQVPGIPGAAAIRATSSALGAANAVLGRLRRSLGS